MYLSVFEGVDILLDTTYSSGYSQERFARLRAGDTYAEVVETLGTPFLVEVVFGDRTQKRCESDIASCVSDARDHSRQSPANSIRVDFSAPDDEGGGYHVKRIYFDAAWKLKLKSEFDYTD